ncbi:unnamed protein product [Moneuplotes crassus]|uniref:AP2/ERF domain-containing protein n=1 Tax=Euplotes crassus TaxID=5936 RepID=A0AAD2D845_EUPCR|nr:unnamed protein product [Moneuplotes crassus]
MNQTTNWPVSSQNFTQGISFSYDSILQELNKFCWCMSEQDTTNSSLSLEKSQIVAEESKSITKVVSSAAKVAPVKQRKRKVNLPNLDANLRRILQAVQTGEDLVFEGKDKTTRGLHRGKSKRRSKYIGVLTNNERWQSLINVGLKKQYIGTFCTEEQAALSYDFYAIGMHFFEAKTNFTYTASQLAPMIEDYFASSNIFDPSKFI